ncbi:MAG: hypothetical protein ACOCWJ_04975 [Verrucomicrobiota bacterium]
MTQPVLKRTDDHIQATPRDGAWTLTFDVRRGAALDSLDVGGRTLARLSSFYVDDVPDSAGVPGRAREFRKTGAAMVSGAVVLPVGAEVALARTWRIAGNHARATADLRWPRGAVVQRHLGLEELTLPGKWTSMHCIPPLQHLIEGAVPFDRELPTFEGERIMLAHWHRPPLAMVFRDADGFAVEVGTGDDIWRWEQSLGYGPESGSYKVFLDENGLELVREPLMCCDEFTPEAREYRFTWHLAWSGGHAGAAERTETTPLSANVADWSLETTPWRESARRLVQNPAEPERSTSDTHACFNSAVAQKTFRRWIRQLAETPKPGELILHGIGPGPCTVPGHVRRGGKENPLPHWDLHALMALSEWTRQILGREWRVQVEPAGIGRALPSVQGLFQPGGFELETH